MSIAFQKPTIEDKQKLEPYFKSVHEMNCEFTFANMFLWSGHYGGEYAIVDDMLVIRAGEGKEKSYAYPLGTHDVKPIIEKLIRDCEEIGIPFRMHSITNSMKDNLEQLFPGQFEYVPDRDNFDYIYRSEDLINLKGKKYHGKRNHINQFMERNNWSYEPITKENMDDCIHMAEEWCIQNGCDDEGRLAEFCVIKNSFRYFDILGLVGGVLRVDGKVVAFTIGEEINDDVFVVHIEKAYADVNGAYPMINREFITREASQYTYINREEDLGIEGLRKAKLSYKPAILLEEYSVSFKKNEKE
jgi:hypothetical protein